jgi:hypothetical protein
MRQEGETVNAGNGLVVGMRRSRVTLTAIVMALALLALDTHSAHAADAPAGSIQVGKNRYLTEAAQIDTTKRTASLKRDRSARPRIVGGTPASISQMPWQAAVTLSPTYFSGNAAQRLTCGGTLMTSTLVLTAAHCVFDSDYYEFMHPSLFSAVTGRTQLSTTAGQESTLATYYVITNGSGTPLYSPSTGRWDAVLLKLATPSTSPTIKIAGSDERALWTAGRDAHASGWGTTSEGGSISDLLQSVLLPVIADSSCANSYPGDFYSDVMVCAGVPEGGRDTCQGDSGGPLVAPTSSGEFRLIGVTSWGNGCARPGQPGVYSRVADDPMRTLIRNGIQSIAGVDVVGSGAQPPAPPAPATPAPTATTPTTPIPPAVNCGPLNSVVANAQASLASAKKALKKAKSKAAKKRAKKRVAKAQAALNNAISAAAAAGC